ncbi:nucleotide exchange factor GrpE [Ligilactobacillus sp. WILCCON 0076]|uniref:Protein GrpE n=1 Tax=Ligilactobacillus ubinensis TaxID=2876789 RepID=A0A9X2FHZ6_9LACO|nr:nucleotide exchange factor GrpE [Ligilactobacillus ubinensis]MCP0886402.1 nucleotide exchange factor GrpE [Ligilactobacillus ubinensis]
MAEKEDIKQTEQEQDRATVEKEDVKEKSESTQEAQTDADLSKEDSLDLEMQEKVKDLQSKLDSMEDKYLRAEAEMANMHTRFKKEQAQLLKYAGQDLAKAILPAIDNLTRALEIEVDDKASQQLKHGVEMVAQNVETALKENQVTKIAALGKKFDPTLHQAVQTVPVEEGQTAETIVKVFQDGYMFKDRVLRPAMVVVAQ